MEILDPVHGRIEFTPNEVAVIDEPAFQRLRSIKQLGFGEYSFPGATHTRYIHSLGVSHLAGRIFDSIFLGYDFGRPEHKYRLRQTTILAALLHDVGHGPLSHTTEEVMPSLKELQVPAYKGQPNRRATHEDYTIKFVTDSSLSKTLKREFADIDPIHIACLIDKHLHCPDDFFVVNGVNFRTILSQIVSSELDCDRMDYLQRDSHFTGTNYGRVETHWLIDNLTYHQVEDRLHLALNRRALYTFDDFLLSRHHMYLMVYFHHKCIIYDEMLHKYLTSKDCDFQLPADINEYLHYTDYRLYEHLSTAKNRWAKRLAARRPFRVLFEYHTTTNSERTERFKEALDRVGIDFIHASSQARLSKYHTSLTSDKGAQIFVVDQYDRLAKPYPLEKSTQIFQRYEDARRIDRIYVDPEQYTKAEQLMILKRL